MKTKDDKAFADKIAQMAAVIASGLCANTTVSVHAGDEDDAGIALTALSIAAKILENVNEALEAE